MIVMQEDSSSETWGSVNRAGTAAQGSMCQRHPLNPNTEPSGTGDPSVLQRHVPSVRHDLSNSSGS